jgi:hypothetical protein
LSLGPLPIIGVELGSRLENTAISVTERVYAETGERFNRVLTSHPYGRSVITEERVRAEYHLRHLERRQPPVFYRSVADRVGEIAARLGDGMVVVDMTRVGRPVYRNIVDAVNKAIGEAKVSTVFGAVTVTGIAGGVSHSPGAGWLVPRRDLVTAALLLFEDDSLKIAESLDLAPTLIEEFTNFKLKPDPKDDLEGWRLAANDNLVLAVAISTWAAERFLRKATSRPLEKVVDMPVVT